MNQHLSMLLFVASTAAFADAALYVDLAGSWRVTWDHSPDMARADYDDRNWRTVQIPLQTDRALGYEYHKGCWLRRSVDLPDWADRSKLALTLGPFRSVARNRDFSFEFAPPARDYDAHIDSRHHHRYETVDSEGTERKKRGR